MPEHPKLVELEILKAMHKANFNRWEKRRNYEWLLSYAVWGGLAGFIAVVAFGKDSRFSAPAPWALRLTLALAIVVHAFYLYFMVENTLCDLTAQQELETKMKQLSSCYADTSQTECESEPPSPSHVDSLRRSHEAMIAWWRDKAMPFLKPRYGLLAQTAVTILLCIAAEWAALRPAPLPVASTAAAPTSVCEGCTQYFTPPAGSDATAQQTIGQDGSSPRKSSGKAVKSIRRHP